MNRTTLFAYLRRAPFGGALSLLGEMNWQPSAVGEQAGFVGTSGVKVFDPGAIATPAREWSGGA